MRFPYYLILSLFLWPLQAYEQSYNPDKVDAKAISIYDIAIEKLKDEEFEQAEILLKKAIKRDANYIDAYLSLAGLYAQKKQYANASSYYEMAKQKDSNYFSFFYLPYSISLAGEGKFTEALHAVNTFLTFSNLSERSVKSGFYRKRTYEFALEYAKTHPSIPYHFSPKNLGDSVNSIFSEYYPSLTIDDSLLVFTRRIDDRREDFMESDMVGKGYTTAKLMDGKINEEPRKGAITISSNQKWLIFAGYFSGKGKGDFDLYISYFTDAGWSEPENLGSNINSEFWESSPSLSSDNRVLYFSSNRPGGFGGKDLYYSVKQVNGQWGPAQNMGEWFNTKGDEQAPFVHADNQTLYFTSDGLQGYGQADIFMSRKDEFGNWKKPENLGYPINTIDHEGSLAVSADGKTAYYASDRWDSRGGLDLYQFDLRTDIRPKKTFLAKGVVIDAITKKGIPSAVELINVNAKQPLMRIQTDELGNFSVPLPVGNNYDLYVNRKGYFYYTQQLKLDTVLPDKVIDKTIELKPLLANTSMVLPKIQFKLNESILDSVSFQALNKLADMLQENSVLQIQIIGHTDNVGSEAKNQILSQERAKVVVEYLTKQGILASRLQYKGMGSQQPIADNSTEEGRAKNRRTEIVILKN